MLFLFIVVDVDVVVLVDVDVVVLVDVDVVLLVDDIRASKRVWTG